LVQECPGRQGWGMTEEESRTRAEVATYRHLRQLWVRKKRDNLGNDYDGYETVGKMSWWVWYYAAPLRRVEGFTGSLRAQRLAQRACDARGCHQEAPVETGDHCTQFSTGGKAKYDVSTSPSGIKKRGEAAKRVNFIQPPVWSEGRGRGELRAKGAVNKNSKEKGFYGRQRLSGDT